MQVQCPPGKYGGVRGLRTPYCSGPCDENFFCPPASISAQEEDCPGQTIFVLSVQARLSRSVTMKHTFWIQRGGTHMHVTRTVHCMVCVQTKYWHHVIQTFL